MADAGLAFIYIIFSVACARVHMWRASCDCSRVVSGWPSRLAEFFMRKTPRYL